MAGASEREQLEKAIAAQEALRPALGDAVVDAVVRTLRDKLASLASPAESRRQVAVLFADVSGFTAMSETMDAEEVREVMNAVWDRLDRAVVGHGGLVDKHIGDAVMALFGAKTAREDDAERAVRAALAMHSELRDYAAQAPPAAQGLRMRIGIHSGPVVVGTVGANAEFTAMGDAVNLASRLEHAAPVGGILVSHDLFRQVESLFEAADIAPIAVKGKKDPVRAHVVLGPRSRDFRMTALRDGDIDTAMVGRDAELAALEEALGEVRRGAGPRWVTVCAPAGLGKSRLRYEFERRYDGPAAGVWFLKGRALPQTSGVPYALLRDAFSARFDILETDSAAVARDKFERGAAAVLGEAEGGRARELSRLLGLGVADGSGPPPSRERGLEALTRFLERAGAAAPVVAVFEDVHWADHPSLDALSHALREAPRTAVLVAAFARPAFYERRAGWAEGEAFHRRLELSPLGGATMDSLVRALLRRLGSVPAALRERVVDGSEGNPFYAEQIVKMLLDQGVLSGGERWTLDEGRLAALRVPPTLVGVLQARVDGLPAAEREALQAASVVGRIFWDHALEACGLRSDAVAAALAGLAAKELAFPRPASSVLGSAEYIFKHALLHDVVYESVLLRERRSAHARVAAWLESRGGGRDRERSPLVAQHYSLAGDERKASVHWDRAGAAALSVSAFPEARDCFARALDGAEDRGRLLVRLGQALNGVSEFAEAESRLREALALGEAAGNRRLTAGALTNLARVLGQTERYGEMSAACERAAALSEQDGDRDGVADALGLAGASAGLAGDFARAEPLVRRSLELHREAGDRLGEGRNLNDLGLLHSRQGRPAEALPFYRQARDLIAEAGAKDGCAQISINLATARLKLGDVAGSVEEAEAACAIYRETGNRKGLANALEVLARGHRRAGSPEAARGALLEALALCLAIKDASVGRTVLEQLEPGVDAPPESWEERGRRIVEAS